MWYTLQVVWNSSYVEAGLTIFRWSLREDRHSSISSSSFCWASWAWRDFFSRSILRRKIIVHWWLTFINLSNLIENKMFLDLPQLHKHQTIHVHASHKASLLKDFCLSQSIKLYLPGSQDEISAFFLYTIVNVNNCIKIAWNIFYGIKSIWFYSIIEDTWKHKGNATPFSK